MTGQPLCRILASLLCGAIGFGALGAEAQQLVPQTRADYLLIDLHSIRDDVSLRAQLAPDPPYLYKGWTQAQKVDLIEADGLVTLRIWDRSLVEAARVESEQWEMELGTATPTSMMVQSQGGRGTYDLGGVPLQSLNVYAQATELRFTFPRPGAQRLELMGVHMSEGGLEIDDFLNARPELVVLQLSGTRTSLDLGGTSFPGETRLILRGEAKSLALVLRRDIGVQVRAPEAARGAFSAPHMTATASGWESQGFDAAPCRLILVFETMIPNTRVTWEEGGPVASPQPPVASRPSALPVTPPGASSVVDAELEALVAAFVALVARQEYAAGAAKLRELKDLAPGDGRLLFLESWLRAHPSPQFVPVVGEAEKHFREGLDLYVAGAKPAALAQFRAAAALDPSLASAAVWARKTAEELAGGAAEKRAGGSAPEPAGANTIPSGFERIVVHTAAPVFAMRAPGRMAVRADRIEIEGQVGDDVGIERIELEVNGAPLRDAAGLPLAVRPEPADSTRKLAFAVRVPLRPGENEVWLTAYDRDATTHRTRERVLVLRMPPLYRTSAFYVGIGSATLLALAVWLVLRQAKVRTRA